MRTGPALRSSSTHRGAGGRTAGVLDVSEQSEAVIEFAKTLVASDPWARIERTRLGNDPPHVSLIGWLSADTLRDFRFLAAEAVRLFDPGGSGDLEERWWAMVLDTVPELINRRVAPAITENGRLDLRRPWFVAESVPAAKASLLALQRLRARALETKPAAERPSYGEILRSLAPQMPKGRPGAPDPVEPTPDELLRWADQLTALDGVSPDDRRAPIWHASLRLITEWVLAYGLWIEKHRPDLLSDAPTLHALIRRGPDGRAGEFARYPGADLARDLRLNAGRWETGEPGKAPTPAKPAEPVAPGGPTKKPLSEREGWVLEVIRSAPQGTGITGPAIIADVRQRHRVVIEQGTLTKHIIPKLKKYYGVRNRRRVGYYIER